MSVEAKIRIYIEEHGISTVELYHKTRIAPPKLTQSLQEKRRFSFLEYQTICWALGVGVEEFMEPAPPEVAP